MNFDPTDQDIVVNADELREFGSQLYQKAGVPKVDADLSDYVVQKGMDGIFYYLAREEAAIREDPAGADDGIAIPTRFAENEASRRGAANTATALTTTHLHRR